VDWEGWRFEIVDMDGKAIDKVLATRMPAGGGGDAPAQPTA
jgi:putative hemolysin